MALTTSAAKTLALLATLLGPAGAQAASSAPLPALPANLGYAILMDGDPIGHETYDFRQDGGHVSVSVTTKTDVKVLFLNFHYRHARQEEWLDGQLQSLRANTDDDGSKHHVEADAKDGSLSLAADGKPVSLPPDSLPLTLWNKALLATSTLYGVIDAQPYHVTSKDLGAETLTLAGKPVATEHYRIDGDVQRDLWYGEDGLLVQTTFERKGYPIKIVRE
jgi:hypothetical protein